MSARDALREIATACAGRRVAYVCGDPGIGVFGTKGASVHVQSVIRVLRAAGAHITLFAAKLGGEAPEDLSDLAVHVLPSQAKGPDAAARERHLIACDDQIARVVAAAGAFDLYYERYSLFSASAAQWAANRGTPVIVEVNAPLIDEHDAQRGLTHRREADDALQRLLSAADLAVCVSEPVRSWVAGHAPATRAVAIANGADIHRITPAPERHGAPVTIGFVGTLKPWHGVEVLLDAAAPLVRSDGGPRLLIVGDGPLAPYLDERTAALDLDVERTGAVDPQSIPHLLQRMDIGVAPYPAEADSYFSPLKVLEYLAAGLPVVASEVGQLPGMVDHGRTGLLVPPSDPEALRSALDTLATDAAMRAAMGRAARAQAESAHSWEHTVAQTLRALGSERLGVLAA